MTSTLKIQNLNLRQDTLRRYMRRYARFESLNFCSCVCVFLAHLSCGVIRNLNVIINVAPQADSVNADGEICVEDRSAPVQVEGPSSGSSDLCYWPTSSSLTARLRRLITAYQRSYRREQLKMEAAEKGDRRRRRCEQATKLKEIARQERQQRYVPQENCY